VQYVRGNFWAGETFTDLDDAQPRVPPGAWSGPGCRSTARIHGIAAARPAEMFTELELRCLRPVPAHYDVPTFTRVKVHRDFHVEVANALYSVPESYLGQYLDARATADWRPTGQAVLYQPTGQDPPAAAARRAVHRPDRPTRGQGRVCDARLSKLVTVCAGTRHRTYAERMLDDPLPWTRLRRAPAALTGPPLRPLTSGDRLLNGRWTSTW
jgi:hypothetical protein